MMEGNRDDGDADESRAGHESDADTLQETSFVTATEGLEDATSRADISSLQHDAPPEGKSPTDMPSSSRNMPVPSHLDRRRAYEVEDGTESTAPPPSYVDVVSHPSDYSTAAADEGVLTPEEIAVVLKMRSGNSAYRVGPSSEEESHESYAEAIEMTEEVDKNYRRSQELSPDERDGFSPIDGPGPDDGPKPRHSLATAARRSIDLSAAEAGEACTTTTSRAEFECTSLGPLNGPISAIGRLLCRQSASRLLILGALGVGIVGLILFVSLFPASFVYIEYHEVALAQSKMTNEVDRGTIYYPGCYVLGPDTQLVRFQASAHSVVGEIGVFTKDTISITMRYSLVYFIRPEEVGLLYSMFMKEYRGIFQKIIDSTIKNSAGPEIRLDEFRFNRTNVEKKLHDLVRRRLGGTCCPACCPKNCQSNTFCDTCLKANCDLGYHVDVRFFNLLSVYIPDEVFQQYLKRTLLEVESEKEYFLQEHAVTTKETEFMTQQIKNEANEIMKSGYAEAEAIKTVAEADKEVTVQKSFSLALGSFYQDLNVTKEDHKLSLMMIRGLEESSENLYQGYGFEQNTFYKP